MIASEGKGNRPHRCANIDAASSLSDDGHSHSGYDGTSPKGHRDKKLKLDSGVGVLAEQAEALMQTLRVIFEVLSHDASIGLAGGKVRTLLRDDGKYQSNLEAVPRALSSPGSWENISRPEIHKSGQCLHP